MDWTIQVVTIDDDKGDDASNVLANVNSNNRVNSILDSFNSSRRRSEITSQSSNNNSAALIFNDTNQLP